MEKSQVNYSDVYTYVLIDTWLEIYVVNVSDS